MVLSKEHEKKIIKNFTVIVKNINVEPLLDYFIPEDILSLEDTQRIRSKVTTEDKNREFLSILIKGPPRGYKVFIDLIKADDKIRELADQIESTVVEVKGTKPQTIEDWLGEERIPVEKQKKTLTDKDLLLFSRSIRPGQLLNVGPILEISQATIDNIKYNHVGYHQSAARELLVTWRNKTGHAATVGALLKLLLQAKEYVPDSIDDEEIKNAVYKLETC